MDNAFTSIYLFFFLFTVYKFGACGTCRKNKLWFSEWVTKIEDRGSYRFANSVVTGVTILYHEYMDSKIVKFLSSIHSYAAMIAGKTKLRWERKNGTVRFATVQVKRRGTQCTAAVMRVRPIYVPRRALKSFTGEM